LAGDGWVGNRVSTMHMNWHWKDFHSGDQTAREVFWGWLR
jgi:hypothetical protein